MGKKQTRQNRGARTGGHEHNAPAATKEQATTSAAGETERPILEQPVSHKQQRKFGHN